MPFREIMPLFWGPTQGIKILLRRPQNKGIISRKRHYFTKKKITKKNLKGWEVKNIKI